MPQIDKPVLKGWLTLSETVSRLDVDRSLFYNSGLADWLDYWKENQKSPRMYRQRQVEQMGYWLTVRKGQIALGMIKAKSAILPPPYDGDLAAFVEDDTFGIECPECGGFAVEHPDDDQIWMCIKGHKSISLD